MKKISLAVAAGAAVLMAGPVLAHPGASGHESVLAGLVHPFTGADHLIAMVAVGLWAATMGRRAMVALPLAFVAAMVAGFALAPTGLTLVEPMVMASVIVLGVLVAMAVRVNTVVAAAIVGVFGLFHGFAHGAELGGAGALAFGAGFVAATMTLHLAGIGFGLALGRGALARVAGVGAALGGVMIALG